jgi:transposase-like protein
MPTIARRPAAQRQRQRLQARRLRGAELFATGVRQVEVARQLGVSRQSVHLWYKRWQADGADTPGYSPAAAVPTKGWATITALLQTTAGRPVVIEP